MKKLILSIMGLCLFVSIMAQNYEIDAYNGQTVNTCAGTFYDAGGTGNYSNNESYSVTFCSAIAGAQIVFDFTSFNSESLTYDFLKAYEGTGTGGTLLGSWGGSVAVGQIQSISSGCITFTWQSDISVTYEGWAATISCTFPCQDFQVDILSSSVPYTSGDTIDLCQGESVTFTAGGTYPNNGVNYPQSDATTTFEWNFGDGTTATGASVTHTFTNAGGYYVVLQGFDAYNCDNTNYELNIVRVSTTPTFVGTDIIEDTVCVGDQINFVTDVQAQPWSLSVPPPFAEETFLPDDASGFYQTAISYEIFDPGQTLTSANQIQSVCVNMEHSYLGDLTIQLICPNGQSIDMIVYPSSCGGTFLGEPIDNDSDLNPGVGYDYCWTPTATNGTWNENCGIGTLPAGNYEAASPWTNLVGCPLNGDWQIYIYDNLSSDNGYIFQWMINFDPSIIPTNLWEFQNSYDPIDYLWSGDNIISQSSGVGTAIPTSAPSTGGDVFYTLTAFDDQGCSYDTAVAVYVLPAGAPGCCVIPAPDAGSDNSICGLSYDLSATLTAGNSGLWDYIGPGNASFGSNTSNSTTVTVDTYGAYQFIWFEADGPACTNSDTVVITFNPNLSSAFTTTAINCYEDASTITYTGTASANANYYWDFGSGTATGTGSGPYTVTWPPGNYTVSLYLDENGCLSDTTTINIVSPSEFISKPQQINNQCFDQCIGVASMNVEGGTPPYTYSWAAQDTMYNLCAGTYSCTATDANGCTASSTFNITQPTEVTAYTTVTDAHCNQPDGVATVFPSGGTPGPGFQIIWSDPATQTTATATGLYSGIYFVTVTDNNGCEFETFANVSNLAGVVGTLDTIVNVSCFGEADGLAVYSVTGGVPDYTFEWSTGTIVTIAGTAHLEPNLAADSYTVSVTDVNGCTHSEYFTITEPEVLQGSIVGTDVLCNGGSDGAADLTVTGGTLPYSFNWSYNAQTTEDLANIPANSYAVTVTDANSCTILVTVNITQPPIPLVATTVTEDVSCFGGSDGSIDLSVTGGTSPFTYLWTDSLLTQDLIDMPAGSYFVTVADVNGCTTTTSTIITEPSEIQFTTSVVPASCFGRTDGQASIAVQGGTAPYSYFWSNNIAASQVGYLAAGTYTVYVQDANLCTVSTSVVVTQPDEVEISASPNRTICYGQTINVAASATGGTPNYVFYWSTGGIGTSITVSPTHDTIYTVSAEDAMGCKSIIKVVKINVRPPITATLFADVDTICEADPVIFTVQASGGMAPYVYIIETDTVTLPHTVYPEYSNIYNLQVYDSCGSPPGLDEMNIHVLAPPVNTFISNKTEGCAPLTIQFNETNPHTGQTYAWDFGDPESLNYSEMKNPSHTYMEPGTYDVELTVTSPTYGCISTILEEEMITVHPNPIADFVPGPTTVWIYDSEVQFTNNSLGADYSFWYFGDNTDTVTTFHASHVFEEAGDYQITLIVSTTEGCKDTIYFDSIAVKDVYTFYAPDAFTPNDDGLNDYFTPFIHGLYDGKSSTEFEESYRLRIYDRWGHMIYTTDKYMVGPDGEVLGGWDGKAYGGKKVAAPGVYQWYLLYYDKSKTKREHYGNVTLIR